MKDKSIKDSLQVIQGSKADFELNLFHQFLENKITVAEFGELNKPKGELKLVPTRSNESKGS